MAVGHGRAEMLLFLWLPPRREKAVQSQEQRRLGPRIYSICCQSMFGFLKNNHSWVKNQSVTRHQPQ